MNGNQRPYAPLYRRLVLTTGICGLVGGIFLYLTYVFAYDSDIQHFVYTSPLWILCCAAYAAGMAAVIVNMCGAFRKVSFKKKLPAEFGGGLAEVFFGYFAAVLFAICFLREIAGLTLIAEATNLQLAAAYTSVLPPLYFLVSNLSKKNEVINTLLAFGGAIAVVISMFRDYFDLTLPLNGSVRILATVTSSALLLFFLSEARLHIAPEKSTVPSFILANGCAGLFLTGMGLAQGIFSFTDPERTFDILPQAAMAAVGALAFCRLYRACKHKCFCKYKLTAEDKTEAAPSEQ
ncbi:MAG: hypothetical protein IJ325_06550 [Clostridia bacterium]|nr:hypothetical protein [Clostridia bacterium]